MENTKGQQLSKAKDRFKYYLYRSKEPTPMHYFPKTNFADESILKSNARAIIGKSKLDILDQEYHKRERD